MSSQLPAVLRMLSCSLDDVLTELKAYRDRRSRGGRRDTWTPPQEQRVWGVSDRRFGQRQGWFEGRVDVDGRLAACITGAVLEVTGGRYL